MSSTPHKPDGPSLDAYLDGTLSDSDRALFQRQLAANESLQAELQRQMRIEDSLARRFLPPAAPADLAARLHSASEVPTVRFPARRRWMLAGATAAAAAVWGIVGWQFFAADRRPVYDPVMPLAQIYDTRVAAGFKPTWVCEDDHVFAKTFFDRQGQGLLLAAMPAGTRMVGLAYFGGLSRYTTTMLARVGDAPVMVFVDRLENDEHPASPDPQSGLHLFRKQLGSLVMYELTPLAEPRVMDYLYAAEVPPAKATGAAP